ncbi:unnamed protein product, partial [Ectocarpus fasciculatus]
GGEGSPAALLAFLVPVCILFRVLLPWRRVGVSLCGFSPLNRGTSRLALVSRVKFPCVRMCVVAGYVVLLVHADGRLSRGSLVDARLHTVRDGVCVASRGTW